MSSHSDTVERYIEGFRRSDHAQILSCPTDDIVWEIRGHTTIEGKHAFDDEIENDAFESPSLRIDRMIETSDTVVALGGGSLAKKTGETFAFGFCEVFTFRGDAVCHLDTYHINLA